MQHFLGVALEAPETREKVCCTFDFDPSSDPKIDGDSLPRVPVLKNILGVFPLIYERKWGQNGALTCGDAEKCIANYKMLRYNIRKLNIYSRYESL